MLEKLIENDWSDEGDFIDKTFEFENFSQAVEFVNKVAKIAESMNHHPDIVLHDYKYVTVNTYTHSENTVTKKDIELATKIDQLI